MAVQHLWQSGVGPPGVLSPASNNVLGFPFIPANDIACFEIGWYRVATGAGAAVPQLRIVNQTQGAFVPGALITTPTDTGSVGWQYSTLPQPVTLYAGQTYTVCALWPAGRSGPYTGGGYLPPAPSFVTFPSNATRYVQVSAAWVVPTGFDTGQHTYWLDAGLDDTISPPAPGSTVTAGDVDAALYSWLIDGSGNDHPAGGGQPGLPATTKVAVNAVKTVTDRLDALNDAAIDWLNETSANAVDLLNDVNAGAVAALNNLAARVTGSGAGGGSAFYSSGGLQVAQSAADTLALVQLIAALQRNALATFPGTPWVQTDETTFDTSLAWAVEADLYVVSFADLGSNLVNTVAAGVDVSYRLAWWCPLIGAFGQQRRFVDFPDAHLWLDGQRLPGLLLHSPAGGTGTVQAWTYQ